MDYTIAKGDCLWNIVKQNYNCKSNTEIANLVNQITKENGISNANLIFAGNTISLPETDSFISHSNQDDPVEEPSNEELSLIDKFDDWTNSEENYNKALDGEDVESFKMFDMNLSSYSSDLKDFAQEYINKYDTDKDGVMNKSEFISMALNGEGIPDENSEEYTALYDRLFSDLNLDDDENSINAGEFASYLYVSDMDWNKYSTTLDIASSVDGQLDYNNYQSLSALEPGTYGYYKIQSEKQEFFDNYYAKKN